MESNGAGAAETPLERVKQDVLQWRQTRPKPGPMPESLWKDAVEVARVVGVYRVVKALNVNYMALKQRVAEHEGRKRGRPRKNREVRATRQFIEMSSAPVLATAPKVMAGAVIEVAAPDGARLCIRVLDGSPIDIGGLLTAFRAG